MPLNILYCIIVLYVIVQVCLTYLLSLISLKEPDNNEQHALVPHRRSRSVDVERGFFVLGADNREKSVQLDHSCSKHQDGHVVHCTRYNWHALRPGLHKNGWLLSHEETLVISRFYRLDPWRLSNHSHHMCPFSDYNHLCRV